MMGLEECFQAVVDYIGCGQGAFSIKVQSKRGDMAGREGNRVAKP